MVTPYKEIEKYIKIEALAKGGVGGEATNAMKMLERLEQKYPNIKRDVQRYKQVMGEEDNQPEPEPQGRHWSDVYEEQQRAKQRRAKWGNNWGNMASQAFDWATNMASQAFGKMYARDLASQATMTVRSNPSGTKSINVKIEQSALEDIRRMDEEQRTAYCNALAEKFFEQVFFNL